MKQIWLVLLAACGGSDMEATPDATLDAGLDALVFAPVPDLRFKFVGAFDAYDADLNQGVSSGISTTETGEKTWSPVTSNGQGLWQALRFFPKTSDIQAMSSKLTSGMTSGLATDVAALPSGSVVTSLSFAFDASMSGDQLGDYGLTAIAPAGPSALASARSSSGSIATEADVATYVAARAAEGLVVTALAFDGTKIAAFAYGIANDTASYETSVLTATVDTIEAQAQALAAGGYTITAFGQTTETSFALVGTRVAGHTTPRMAKVSEIGDGALLGQGYAVVGNFVEMTPSFTEQGIFEK